MGSRCWEWGQTRHRSVSPESRPGLSAHLCPLAWSLVRHETSQTALCTHVDSGQPRISEVWLLLSNVVPKRTVAVKQQARFGRVLTPPAPHPSPGTSPRNATLSQKPRDATELPTNFEL